MAGVFIPLGLVPLLGSLTGRRKSAAVPAPAPAGPAAPVASPTPVVSAAAPPPDRFEQLRKLGELRATGVLTQEEFEHEKARLLAGN
jgi:hypothetical protein